MNRIQGFLRNLIGRPRQSRRAKPAISDPQPQRQEVYPESKLLLQISYRKGDFIGQYYEVFDVLGMGGFGVVYKVYSNEVKQVFAVKTFRDEYLNDDTARELFRREAQLWVDMERHPYLVRAYYVEEISHRLYIIMEYIAPGDAGPNSLEGYLRSQPPDLIQSLRWAIQFCHGMEYAYSKGLRCHRDIKPSNIMIGNDRRVKISDFGLSGILQTEEAMRQARWMLEHRRTLQAEQTIAVGGTPTHMSPEQFIDSASCDERSDIYSFGVVLYEMASGGMLPFFVPPRSASEEERARWSYLMFRLHTEAPIPRLDSKLFPIIRRCLEKEPRKRYSSFAQLRGNLEILLKRCNGEILNPPPLEDLKAWEYANKGVSLHDLGRFDEALECFERALSLDSRDARTWSNKANTLAALKRFEEALECCDRALALDPTHVNSWITKGARLAELGRYDESIRCYDRALELAPENKTIWDNKGRCLNRMGRFQEALRCRDKAVELAPRDPETWNGKGVVLGNLGRVEEAVRCYDRALELDPRYAMAWQNKGGILIRMSRFKEALSCFDKALEFEPTNTTAWRNGAFSLVELKRFEDAIHWYDRLLELNSRDAEAWNNKGRILLISLRRPAEALACFENALRIDSRKADVWCSRTTSLQCLGRYAEAIVCCDEALKLDSTCFSAWNDKGNSLNHLNRYEEALPCFDRALEIDRKNPVAWFNKGAALHHLGRLEEAIGLYQRVLKLNPRYPDVLSNKAVAEEKLGRTAEAIHSYEHLILVADANAQSQVEYARKRLSELKSQG